MHRPARRLTIYTFVGLAVLASVCRAGAPPFVAGFERFHRDADSKDADSTGADSADNAQGGRLLLAELSCTACHAASAASLEPKRGPRLDGAARRLRSQWVRQFLADPAATKPGTTMPAIFAGWSDEDRDRAIDALIAFLATEDQPFPEVRSTATAPVATEFWSKGDLDRGKQLYHQVGCVACHEPAADFAAAAQPPSALDETLAQLEPDEIEELGLAHLTRPVASIPHPDLAAKYTLESLTHFLLAPEAVRPSGRMPRMKLLPDEAAAIAGWLLREQSDGVAPDLAPASSERIQEGRRLFTELRCANCHTAAGAPPASPAMSLAELDASANRSCLAAPQPDLPAFGLDEPQRRAIVAALEQFSSTAGEPIAHDDALEFRLRTLNCYACHARGDRGGVGPDRRRFFEVAGHVDLGDEGRIPPPLDGVGRKLNSATLEKVLAGTADVRPHMLARMPVFPAVETKPLPAHFAAVDGADARSADDVFTATDAPADAGRELLNVGCVQCHAIRGERLPGVVGVDLSGTTDRVRPEWFREFLLNPAALKPRTRMPTFFPNGKAPNLDLLDDDVERQIAAIWTYLADLPNQSLPARIEQERVHNFELVPTDQPILLRTFMRDAGMHAIAVGFPAQVHLAFDAETVRLAQLWRGRYLDAHGTWFDRFTPPAAPLGTDVVTFPAGPEFARLESSGAPWPKSDDTTHIDFRGFRLDDDGTPTFLYRFDGLDVEDRLVPAADQTIIRQLRFQSDDPAAGKLAFRALAGTALKKVSSKSYRDGAGLTVTLTGSDAPAGYLSESPDDDETISTWIVPFDPATTPLLTLRYSW